ncbi:MAG: hypothetical protein M3Y50_18450, partial [Acidobacteriota bacterium]|nr:hypothetical protein [Acidobacteriota bacterium]
FTTEETQASADALMGVALPYRAKREPYVAGVRFRENLHRNWQEVGRVDGFLVYCNTLRNARCGRH